MDYDYLTGLILYCILHIDQGLKLQRTKIVALRRLEIAYKQMDILF